MREAYVVLVAYNAYRATKIKSQTDYNVLSQDDLTEALNKLHITVTKAHKINPNIKCEVFIHKVDGLTEDNKMDVQRDINQRSNDDLQDAGNFPSFSYFIGAKLIKMTGKTTRDGGKCRQYLPVVIILALGEMQSLAV